MREQSKDCFSKKRKKKSIEKGKRETNEECKKRA
jgi:hypothetical protein